MLNAWAKSGPDGTYLPVATHLSDVGAAADRLWRVALTTRQRAWFADGLGLSIDDAGRWIVALSASHDIGKATPSFQSLLPDLSGRLQGTPAQHPVGLDRIRHDALSGAILERWLGSRSVPPRIRRALIEAIAGHHGQVRTPRDLRLATQVLQHSPEWDATQDALLDGIVSQRQLAVSAPRGIEGRIPASVVWALAGLVCVADWLGSDVRYFAVNERAASSSARAAEEAIAPSAWALPSIADPSAGFADVFRDEHGGAREPRPLQQAVADLLADDPDGSPRLLVLEDRTGSGKTEAALWAVRHALLHGARGWYVGLPTQATAGQFYRRAAAFGQSLWPREPAMQQLLHGAAALNPPEPWPSAEDDAEVQSAMEAAADAGAWFVGGRRGLLAPLGVGTIDQALLGVLRGKHFFVRLFGLQGKVCVIDEAHAYDAHTGHLMVRAVEWLAALDCSVVILSATLPQRVRQELADAYRRGAASQGVSIPEVPALNEDYPRLLSVGRNGVVSRGIVDTRPPRTVHLKRVSLEDESSAEQVADVVGRLVRDGGCVGVVCNTVRAAQGRFAALRQALPQDTELVLLHSRLRPVERAVVEQRLFSTLGPAGTGIERPASLVVVATQIIEQSLDIDFDVMLTDLAPIDLLVQRAGRLHRHERASAVRGRHQQPTLMLLDTGGGSLSRPHIRSSAVVYEEAPSPRTRG